MATPIGLAPSTMKRLDLYAICTGTFKAYLVHPYHSEADLEFDYFLSTYFDGFTLPEIWKWAKMLPYLHAISEYAAVCFARHLSDAVLAERGRIYSSDKEVAQ